MRRGKLTRETSPTSFADAGVPRVDTRARVVLGPKLLEWIPDLLSPRRAAVRSAGDLRQLFRQRGLVSGGNEVLGVLFRSRRHHERRASLVSAPGTMARRLGDRGTGM